VDNPTDYGATFVVRGTFLIHTSYPPTDASVVVVYTGSVVTVAIATVLYLWNSLIG